MSNSKRVHKKFTRGEVRKTKKLFRRLSKRINPPYSNHSYQKIPSLLTPLSDEEIIKNNQIQQTSEYWNYQGLFFEKNFTLSEIIKIKPLIEKKYKDCQITSTSYSMDIKYNNQTTRVMITPKGLIKRL